MRPAQVARSPDPSYGTGQREQGQYVRQHEEKLVGCPRPQRLKEELKSSGPAEKEGGRRHTSRVPAPQYHNGDCQVPATGCHPLGERPDLRQHERGASQARKPTAHDRRSSPHQPGPHPGGTRHGGRFASGAELEPGPGPKQYPPDYRERGNGEISWSGLIEERRPEHRDGGQARHRHV